MFTRINNWFYDRKQKIKLKHYNTKKYIYELYAYIKNSKKYVIFKQYLNGTCSDALLLAITVFGIKNGNSVLLGISIAISIELSQRYIEWFLQTKKKYR